MLTIELNNIQDSDNYLAEQNHSNPKYILKESKRSSKTQIKKSCIYNQRYGHSFVECRKKNKGKSNRQQKHKELNTFLYQCMKKDKNLTNERKIK